MTAAEDARHGSWMEKKILVFLFVLICSFPFFLCSFFVFLASYWFAIEWAGRPAIAQAVASWTRPRSVRR